VVDDFDLTSSVTWLDALERRHLTDLTFSEVSRALRALSSCYVERRGKLSSGAALETRGKRAAFALFYGPLHFAITREIVRAAAPLRTGIRDIVDLGCGSGAAGAAWALEAGAPRISGMDRNAWAVAEANWTYRQLNLRGRAVQGDIGQFRTRAGNGTAILAAYTLNEVAERTRDQLLEEFLRAAARGARVLVIEPIARRIAPWWTGWRTAFERAGGHAGEWRFPGSLPDRPRALGRAAGLDPRELTARSLWV
jgi:hypothetical protein